MLHRSKKNLKQDRQKSVVLLNESIQYDEGNFYNQSKPK